MTTTVERGFQLDTGTPGVLGVSGVLSFATAATALRDIQATLPGGTVAHQLDLAGVHHSDSAGLACVLAVVAAVTRQGQTLQVTHMPAGMQALAKVCEVDQLLA